MRRRAGVRTARTRPRVTLAPGRDRGGIPISPVRYYSTPAIPGGAAGRPDWRHSGPPVASPPSPPASARLPGPASMNYQSPAGAACEVCHDQARAERRTAPATRSPGAAGGAGLPQVQGWPSLQPQVHWGEQQPAEAGPARRPNCSIGDQSSVCGFGVGPPLWGAGGGGGPGWPGTTPLRRRVADKHVSASGPVIWSGWFGSECLRDPGRQESRVAVTSGCRASKLSGADGLLCRDRFREGVG
jgi:hypothetical protein